MNAGKVSENILKRSVLKYIGSENGAFAGADCAFFTGITADEPAEICGGHALLRACNNAAAEGFFAKAASISIFFPEKLREIKLKAIAANIKETADKLGVKIADGHTEVVAGIKFPIVNASVFAHRLGEWRESKALPGQYIVMTKWAGMSGAARLSHLYKDKLLTRYPGFIIEDNEELWKFYNISEEADIAVNNKAACMNDCSDGGVFAALWQLGDRHGTGIRVNLKDIPVRQETIEVCEFFDINPYKLRSDGSLLIVTENPDKLILGLHGQGIHGAVIGTITAGRDRVVLSGAESRFLEEPRQDEGCMVY